MKNVIFADIDGVLNSIQSLRRNNENRLFYGRLASLQLEWRIKWHLAYLNFENVETLKRLALQTNSEIVILSAWKSLKDWPLIEEVLVQRGLPIGGVIDDTYGREFGIFEYLNNREVNNYIVLDDDLFPDYKESEEIMSHLFACDFYNEGLTDEIASEATEFLNSDNKEKSLRMRILKL